MQVRFYNPKLKPNKEYNGEIQRYTLDEERKIFRIYVVLDQVPELEYMKKFEYDLNLKSELGEFCNNMCIVSEDGMAEFSELEGLRVVVKLRKGNSGKLYVNKIWLDEEYYSEEDNCEEE